MIKGNVRAAINILRKAKSIDDLVTAQNLLRRENVDNQNLEFAMRAFDQNNKGDMTNFIFGPSIVGSGKGLIVELEDIARQRGE